MTEPDSSKYTRDGHEWTHSCQRREAESQVYWRPIEKTWRLFSDSEQGGGTDIQILFCPWCGLELEAMPEEDETA